MPRPPTTAPSVPAVVLAIEGEGMTVKWVGDAGPGASANVPLGSVRALGADGGYADGWSALGGASSSRAAFQKRPEPEICI